MHFWHPCVASLKKSRKFFAEFPEMILKLPFLSTKIFHPKTSYWHVVCRVHNLAREFLPGCSKKSDLVPKLMKNIFSTKYFPSNNSYGHLECTSDKPFSWFLTRGRIFFVHSPKTTRNYNFERKSSLKCSSGDIKGSLDNPVKENLTKDQKCFAQCPKMVNKRFFEKQMILLRRFLWSRWLQFWQPCRRNPKVRRVVLSWMSKIDNEFFLQE